MADHSPTVFPRDAMGRYTGEKPLSQLAYGNPSPAHYNPPPVEIGPEHSLAGRLNSHKATLTPGPADYSPTHGDPTPIQLKGRHELAMEVNVGPGPAAYHPEDDTKREKEKGFSLSGRFEEKSDVCSPGPIYRITEPRSDTNKCTIGSRAKSVTVYNSPGPGQYDIKFDQDKNLHALQFNNRGATTYLTRSTTPGPGAYNVKVNTESNAFTLGARPRSIIQEDIERNKYRPGPGSYDVAKAMEDTIHGPVLGSPPKEKKAKASMPGPGAYTIGNMEEKEALLRAATIVGRRQDITDKGQAKMPGPASYYVQDVEKNKGVTLLGRHDLPDRAGASTPGPAAYNLQDKDSAKQSYVHKVTKSRKTTEYVSPGPASYNVKDLLEKGGFSMAHRVEEKVNSASPGPAAYQQDLNGSNGQKSPDMGIKMKGRPSPYMRLFPDFK